MVNFYKKKIRFQEGQAVIEAVIALSALLILLAAIAVVITTSLSNTTFSNSQDLANKHAQEGIEIIRNYAKSNNVFQGGDLDGATIFSLTSGDYYCMDESGEISLSSDTVNVRDGCGVNVDDQFVRTVSIAQDFCGGSEFDGIEAVVDVAWSSGRCACPAGQSCTITDRYCHSATLLSCFPRPLPQNAQL